VATRGKIRRGRERYGESGVKEADHSLISRSGNALGKLKRGCKKGDKRNSGKGFGGPQEGRLEKKCAFLSESGHEAVDSSVIKIGRKSGKAEGREPKRA